MAIARERLDKSWVDDQGHRWGQFRVHDIELLPLTIPDGQRSIFQIAHKLGLDIRVMMKIRSAHDNSTIYWGRMRHDVKPHEEVVAHYVSTRRHIDLSILE